MRLRFQTHRRAGIYVRLHFFNIQIQTKYYFFFRRPLPCFWERALPATDFVPFEVLLLLSSLLALDATFLLVVFGWAIYLCD